jgi:glycosyltransferase involved in cell wall biosynthesis
MKILLSHKIEKRISGMWSWMSSFIEGLKKFYPEIQVTDEWCEDFDVYLVCSTTSLEHRDWLDKARAMKKRVILRTGNLPKQSRNRENVFGRLKEYTEKADEVVWQSKWARDYIAWGDIPRKGVVIYNGVNTDIFNKTGEKTDFRQGEFKKVYLYIQSSSDPCKRPDEAFYIFSQKHREYIEQKKGKVLLVIVGRIFNPKWEETNFDFVRGEAVRYLGEILDPKEMAKIMRGCDDLLFPSFNEACSNTILEARACGLDITGSTSGGTPELMELPESKIDYEYMVNEYAKLFKNKTW